MAGYYGNRAYEVPDSAQAQQSYGMPNRGSYGAPQQGTASLSSPAVPSRNAGSGYIPAQGNTPYGAPPPIPPKSSEDLRSFSVHQQQYTGQQSPLGAPPPLPSRSSSSSLTNDPQWSNSPIAQRPSSSSSLGSSSSDQSVQMYGAFSSLPQSYSQDGVAEYMQGEVGKAMAGAARDDRIQQQAGSAVAGMAENRAYQAKVGSAIADNTDNQYLAYVARNETIQKAAGTAVARTAGNREVQQAVGSAVARAAEDKEMQRKVGGALASTGKSGSKWALNAALEYSRK